MADIFVSYSRQDRDRVTPLVAALEAEGWLVWWDPEITPGVEFDTLIASELDAAKAIVVVWTPHSVGSRWVKGEAREAADRGVLAPVRFDNAPLPIDFRAIHTTDMDAWAGDRQSAPFKELCRALKSYLQSPATQSAPPVVPAAKEKKRASVSICVLPFLNMSGDPEQEYFSDGITEDIITDLSKVSALSIASRNTAFTFKGEVVNVARVAEQTQVSHVLEGSVRKSGNRVRINAQLIDAANDDHIWAERYDRDLDDIFALQDEISEAIVKALKLTLLPEEKKALEKRSTSNPEAYKLYLMARQFSVLGNERHQKTIVRLCKRAVELDPNYARAWATMAITYWDMNRITAAREEDTMGAAERAIALDPKLADAHAAIGAAHQGLGGFERGLKACEVAIRLDPNSYEGNRIAGLCCLPLRRYDDGIRYFEIAASAIETEFVAAALVVQCYASKGDQAGARVAAERALRRIEAIIAVEPDHGSAIAYGAAALATLGEIERAKEWAARGRLLDPDNVNLQFNLACAMARAGEVDAALEMLEIFIDNAAKGLLVYIESDSDFDLIRDDSRFVAMTDRANARLSGQAP